MLLCPLSLHFHRIRLCAQRYFTVHCFHISQYGAQHQRSSCTIWQWVPGISLPFPFSTCSSAVINKLLSDNEDNVTMQLCSVIWLPCGFNLEVSLDEAVNSPHLTFSLPSPPVSLLEIKMAFPHSGYWNISHKLISTSRKQIAGHSTRILASVGEEKAMTVTHSPPWEAASRKAALWADTLHHFPFLHPSAVVSLGPFCQARKGKEREGRRAARKAAAELPLLMAGRSVGCHRNPQPVTAVPVLAKPKGRLGKLQLTLTAQDQAPYVGA